MLRRKKKEPVVTSKIGSSAIHVANRTRWDVQDDPEYWNEDDRLLEDTCRALLPQVLANPMAGYGPNEVNPEPKIFELLHRYEGMSDHSPVLEMGCGGGRMALIWMNTCVQVGYRPPMFLTDHSPKAVAIAQARFQGLSPNPNDRFEAVEGGSLAQRFNAHSVGVVYTHTALQHNSHWKQEGILKAFHTILKDRGYLLLWCEATFTSDRHPEVALWHSYSDDRGSAGTAAWWIARVAAVGFELIEYHDETFLFRKL